jgi:hypothetical protein
VPVCVAAGSLTLVAFGLDSVIEVASAGVLIWRLTGSAFSGRTERTASTIGGGLLFALAAYIVTGAVWSLWMRHGEAFSIPGLIVALLAMPIMTLLARRKTAGQPGDAGGCRREHHLRLAVAGRRGRPDCRFDARRVAPEPWSGRFAAIVTHGQWGTAPAVDEITLRKAASRTARVAHHPGRSARAPTDRPKYLLAGTIASAPTCQVSAT